MFPRMRPGNSKCLTEMLYAFRNSYITFENISFVYFVSVLLIVKLQCLCSFLLLLMGQWAMDAACCSANQLIEVLVIRNHDVTAGK